MAKVVKVKICGITNRNDALFSVELGASALGFVFYKDSPRYISPSKAKKIIEELPPFVTPVGVFVNQREGAVKDIINFCGIRTLQFHGDETPMYCRRFRGYQLIKAFRVKDDFDFNSPNKYSVAAFLFDTYQEDALGGTGKTFNWHLLSGIKIKKPFILSGGLNPQNVLEAIQVASPYAIDVASGVERAPGQKDGHLLKEFFQKLS
ncbi:MAG: hypothetical protein A2787_00690 [Omnitrophica WOR_2 bacterium RIFCSPHIGHO2_01_FULL_48_9]|nr:MAG: hypothetical protein A3D10_01330 [Omnitrophica WOR_2 bacterium RIFCSPHIGHO2_02_FULL_48_11]OGX34122.1 MAG: hypothetical protein A2787_00690 [Omnitrophica WOR_2 bacterium RIFCSPHIGHO2_01_FULL_48_9]